LPIPGIPDRARNFDSREARNLSTSSSSLILPKKYFSLGALSVKSTNACLFSWPRWKDFMSKTPRLTCTAMLSVDALAGSCRAICFNGILVMSPFSPLTAIISPSTSSLRDRARRAPASVRRYVVLRSLPEGT
jgi:hypothetical protein